MSVKAMSWALELAPVEDPTEALLLVALADRANDDGTGAYPSQSWLAFRCRITDRSVRRILASLEERKIITRGDQRMVLHYLSDRRPVVWNLNLDLDRTRVTGGTLTSARSPMTERPDVDDRSDRTPTSDKPSSKPSSNHPGDDLRQRAFDAFWAEYPRKVAKPAAVKAFAKALKVAKGPDPIMAGLRKFQFSDDLKFVPHPASWLNAERWADEAPATSGPKRSKLEPWEI